MGGIATNEEKPYLILQRKEINTDMFFRLLLNQGQRKVIWSDRKRKYEENDEFQAWRVSLVGVFKDVVIVWLFKMQPRQEQTLPGTGELNKK